VLNKATQYANQITTGGIHGKSEASRNTESRAGKGGRVMAWDGDKILSREGANLQQADLRQAILLGAANFMRTILIGANLEGSLYLGPDQLCMAQSLYQLKLDPDIKNRVNEYCPQLPEKPKSFSKRTVR
jgi:hypothetical protein